MSLSNQEKLIFSFTPPEKKKRHTISIYGSSKISCPRLQAEKARVNFMILSPKTTKNKIGWNVWWINQHFVKLTSWAVWSLGLKCDTSAESSCDSSVCVTSPTCYLISLNASTPCCWHHSQIPDILRSWRIASDHRRPGMTLLYPLCLHSLFCRFPIVKKMHIPVCEACSGL